jgi:hypothetical protein
LDNKICYQLVTTLTKKDSRMSECHKNKLVGTLKNNKNIICDFKGDHITSNVGMLLLAAADKKFKTLNSNSS